MLFWSVVGCAVAILIDTLACNNSPQFLAAMHNKVQASHCISLAIHAPRSSRCTGAVTTTAAFEVSKDQPLISHYSTPVQHIIGPEPSLDSLSQWQAQAKRCTRKMRVMPPPYWCPCAMRPGQQHLMICTLAFTLLISSLLTVLFNSIVNFNLSL